MIGTKSTMAGIASAGALLREDVYDETGLKGYYIRPAILPLDWIGRV